MNVDQVRHLGEIRTKVQAVLAWIHSDGSTDPPEPQWMDFWDNAPEDAAWLCALVDDLVAENGRLREFIDPDRGVWRIGKSLEQAISEVGGDAARGERNPE